MLSYIYVILKCILKLYTVSFVRKNEGLLHVCICSLYYTSQLHIPGVSSVGV